MKVRSKASSGAKSSSGRLSGVGLLSRVRLKKHLLQLSRLVLGTLRRVVREPPGLVYPFFSPEALSFLV